MTFIRILASVAFMVFCVTGLMTWAMTPPDGVPWWLPFAAALTIPAIVGGAVFIIEGRGVFRW